VEIDKYPEIDLFGYMKTVPKIGAFTRNAVVRLSNAISLERYCSDIDFLNNMGLAKRINENNSLVQIEIHKSYYAYTITMDLDKIGIGETAVVKKENDKSKEKVIKEKIEIDNKEKAKRVTEFLNVIKVLSRDIRGRRENFSPLFIIGGIYSIKNPFFENRLFVNKNNLEIEPIMEAINIDKEVTSNTLIGYISSTFSNSKDIQTKLKPRTISETFETLYKQVNEYYG
jgi:CRISPR-associated protein Cst2